jgi:MFS family permease
VKFFLLAILYVAEGLPFGFQAALPVFLRERGTPLVVLGFVGVLSLPWMLKPLWAPLVDRYGATRRAWMLPVLVGLALTCAAAGMVSLDAPYGVETLLAIVLLMNLLAATLDIAVDGLAVDLLAARELGTGNAIQVVGYKLGMLAGGGLFLWASATVSWRTLLFTMAAVIAGVAIIVAVAPATRTRAHPPLPLREILGALGRAFHAREGRAFLLFLATYKLGESMATAMWKPLLVDSGFDRAFIGVITGVGMATSILGSITGGWLATRLPPILALSIPAAARVVPLALQALVALAPTPEAVVAVTCLETFTGGALTTVVFARMMARVDRTIGASHYTALAAVEVAGKLPGQPLAGAIAAALGFPALFALAAATTAALLALILPLRRRA